MNEPTQFDFDRLETGRFGIYADGRLLASIGCRQACERIVALLQQRQRADFVDKSIQQKARRCVSYLEQLYICSSGQESSCPARSPLLSEVALNR